MQTNNQKSVSALLITPDVQTVIDELFEITSIDRLNDSLFEMMRNASLQEDLSSIREIELFMHLYKYLSKVMVLLHEFKSAEVDAHS